MPVAPFPRYRRSWDSFRSAERSIHKKELHTRLVLPRRETCRYGALFFVLGAIGREGID